jgi:ATP-binding cassette subfamily C protein CydCD
MAFFAVALATRAVVGAVVEAAIAARQRAERARWHRDATGSLRVAGVAGLHRLDAAIDAAANEPSLAAARGAAVTAVGGLGLVAYWGGWLCIVIIVGLLALSIPAYISAGRRSAHATEEFHQRRAVLVSRQVEVLRSITDLRAAGAVAYGADEIAAVSNAEGRAVSQGVRRTIRSTLVSEFLAGVSVGLVAMVVGLELWHHHIGLFAALVAVLATAETFGWWRRYGLEFHRRDEAAHAIELLSSVVAMPSAISSDLLTLREVATAAPARAVSLTVNASDRVRVVGPSGIGKTSLIETALGLREPVSGDVHRGARSIGWVHPANHFVRGSVRDNLAGADDVSTSVLQELGLQTQFPLDRTIDEEARDVSSGERSLLALARALIADCDLLVIDDVAAQWDPQTRSRVRAAIERRPGVAIVEAGHEVSLLDDAATVIDLARR